MWHTPAEGIFWQRGCFYDLPRPWQFSGENMLNKKNIFSLHIFFVFRLIRELGKSEFFVKKNFFRFPYKNYSQVLAPIHYYFSVKVEVLVHPRTCSNSEGNWEFYGHLNFFAIKKSRFFTLWLCACPIFFLN